MTEIALRRRFPGPLYRRMRRGIITLPELEERLIFDMRRMRDRVAIDGATALYDLYVSEILHATIDPLAELEDDVDELRGFLGPHILGDVDVFERTAEAYLPDLPGEMIEALLIAVRGYGGVGGLLDVMKERIARKRRALQLALEHVAEGANDMTLGAAIADIEDAVMSCRARGYPGWEGSELTPWDQIVAAWRTALEAAQRKVSDATSYWELQDAKSELRDLMEMICGLYPMSPADVGGVSVPLPYGKLAQALGVEGECSRLARHEVICMLLCGPIMCIVVFLAVLMCSRDCAG